MAAALGETGFEERVRRMAGLPVRASADGVELLPGSLREAARAQAVRAMLGAEAARVSVSLEAFDRIEAPDPVSCSVRVGARARLGEVEATLRGWALTLGGLSPRASGLTVGEWLEGRWAGLRAAPGNRLESSVLSLGVALEGGGIFQGSPAARCGGGPVLEGLFLGGGGQAGRIVEARLAALPRPDLEEGFHALLESAEAVVALLREAAARDVPVVHAQTRRMARGFALSLLVATRAFRARHDRAVLEELVRGRGESRVVGGVSSGEAGFEGEICWDRLARAVATAGPLSIHRIARESVVVAADGPVKGALALDAPPEPFASAVLAALLPAAEVRP